MRYAVLLDDNEKVTCHYIGDLIVIHKGTGYTVKKHFFSNVVRRKKASILPKRKEGIAKTNIIPPKQAKPKNIVPPETQVYTPSPIEKNPLQKSLQLKSQSVTLG